MDETTHDECFKGHGERHSCRDVVGVGAVVAIKCVRVCPGTTVSFRRHRSQYLNFGLPNAQHRVGAQ